MPRSRRCLPFNVIRAPCPTNRQSAAEQNQRVEGEWVPSLAGPSVCPVGRRFFARLRIRDLTAEGGKTLKKIVRKIRRHLFLFVTRRDLTATNNGSERAIRPCTVYRKITNGFRSEWGAQLYADIRSVVETGRRRRIRAIDAIRLALEGAPLQRSQ
jgi:hypothetical protein